jgi:L-alanine-DL-glutamate epimerase-like enolase superfamily enzyme
MSRTYDRLAALPVKIDRYELEGLTRVVSPQFTRFTTVFHLFGDGHEGQGEDVTYGEEDQVRQQQAGPVLDLAGEWTLDSLSAHLNVLELFGGAEPGMPAYQDYRTWAIESAALDLALRQAGTSLHELLDREPRPLTFGVSLRLGDPPSSQPVLERRELYGDVRFKLDYDPAWNEELIDALAATGGVDVIDFKGAYKGTIVDVDTVPEIYKRCAEAFPTAWLEDPDLTDPDAATVLEPHRDRITWDAPIHQIADLDRFGFTPKTCNCKPSRFGPLHRLFDFYDHCEREGIALYGGGQSELACGRGQIQLLASMFHPDGPNDVAPSGWDHLDFPRTGLPVSPLDSSPDRIGFRRA